MFKVSWYSKVRKLTQLVLLTSIVAISGCNDDDKTQAPPPELPPVAPPTVTTAERLDIKVNSAHFSNDKLTIEFFVKNPEGYGFVGLSGVEFTVAKLIPSANGSPSYWHSYIKRVKDETADFPDSKPTSQPYNEGDGELIDSNDGSYQYSFATNVKAAADPVSGEAIVWEENLTHRVAIEVSKSANNPLSVSSYDWVPSGNALTETRHIVDNASCNNCHTDLAAHGGYRKDTAYCVTCHTPGNIEPISEETADFKIMVHKIHRGADLPGIAAGGDGTEYSFFGWGNYPTTFAKNVEGEVSGVHFPQDIRNCTNCHVGEEDKLNDPSILATATPDGDNWKNAPSLEACSSCHDDMAFNEEMLAEKPYLRKHQGLFPATNEDCSTCHSSGQLYAVENFHNKTIDKNKDSASAIVIETVAISQLETTINITVNITKDGTPINDWAEVKKYLIMPNTEGYYGPEDAQVLVNWDNGQGYQTSYSTNEVGISSCSKLSEPGHFNCPWDTSSMNNGEPITDGTISVTYADTQVCLDAQTNLLADCTDEALTLVTQARPLSIDHFSMPSLKVDTSYQVKVGASKENCQSCHNDFVIHAEDHAATDFAQCTSCHNSTRAAYYDGRPADLKYHVHKLHANNAPAGNGHGAEHYPSELSNCMQCHTSEQIDLPLVSNPRASHTSGVSGWGAPTTYTSPTAVVCASCHIGPTLGYIDPQGQIAKDNEGNLYLDGKGNEINFTAKEQNTINHMILAGGAVFGAVTEADATGKEACATCHAIDSAVGVSKVHGLIK